MANYHFISQTRVLSRFLLHHTGNRFITSWFKLPSKRIANHKCLPQGLYGGRFLSTEPGTKAKDDESSHGSNIEQPLGNSEKLEFQAETRSLLNIVAKSLYSNKEVFVRELISNASDALEKLRYKSMSENPDADIGPLEIRLSTDKQNRILTIQDTGIGMTKEELISNLGTIARSGTKAFLEELKKKSSDTSSVIGQFGVGFYSSFMVANKVQVFTKTRHPDAVGYCWTSDGCGSYEIQEADNVAYGTKIVLNLKPECREFSDDDTLEKIIKKYSNFINCDIYVNDRKTNVIQPLWLMDPKDITKEQHKEFYNFISNSYDNPRFIMHYKTDAPLTIRALLYIPSIKPIFYDLNVDCEISLYARRVLIQSKANDILPKWCRFIKGVVDSEDIPLNLSRELLQNSLLIAKLREVLTNRVIKFLTEKSKKEPEAYKEFFEHYGIYLKSGVAYGSTPEERESISKLLRYESSSTKSGETISLSEYCKRANEDQKQIYYLATSSRALAESSPYYEPFKKKNIEVLFCYEPYDEQIFLQLHEFAGKQLSSVENHIRDDKDSSPDDTETIVGTENENSAKDGMKTFISWAETQLKDQAHSVGITKKLDSHPCVVTVEEWGRQYLKSKMLMADDKERFMMLKPKLQINPNHPIIKKLSDLSTSNPELATLVLKQLYSNALMSAGLITDPHTVLSDMNKLLELALEKH